MYSGGDIEEITYKHPDLGSGTWQPKSNEDFTFDPGGIRNEDDANGITGAGEMIVKKNRVRPSMEGPVAWDMKVRDELKQARQIARSDKLATWFVRLINGAVFSGQGTIVGDIQGTTQGATMSIKIAGEKEWEQIA